MSEKGGKSPLPADQSMGLPRWLSSLKSLVLWLSGILMASGLWMFDEILSLARYCGRDCLYQIPLLGTWYQYDAEALAWLMVFSGFVLGWAAAHR